jgi:hypothetical protein
MVPNIVSSWANDVVGAGLVDVEAEVAVAVIACLPGGVMRSVGATPSP